jgi:hypothetical protein
MSAVINFYGQKWFKGFWAAKQKIYTLLGNPV